MQTYLTYFDQFRHIFGALAFPLLYCQGILPPKHRFGLRLAAACLLSLLAALSYVPLAGLAGRSGLSLLTVSVLYWIPLSLIPVFMIRLCWESTWAGTLFRAILVLSSENFSTAFFYYLYTKMLFPALPSSHPALYFLSFAVFYGLILSAGHFLLRRRILTDEGGLYRDPGKTAWAYFYTYVSVYVMVSSAKLCFELLLPPLEEAPGFSGTLLFLRAFMIFIMVLLSVSNTMVMLYAYQTLTMQNEKQILMQMMRDRQAQYEFSKETIEAVNRQAHDLKHQLRALEMIPGRERRDFLKRAERSVDYYDAVFETGAEALDTILTEKSLYCRSRNIRLSCSIQTRLAEKIGIVDLYTLLGNALDNAIEAADSLSDPEKKTISLTVRDQGDMVYIQLENYYDGTLIMEDGLPLTTRKDPLSHGFGTKSIRSIAERLGGSTMIRTQDQIFSLEILLPT